MDKDVLIRFIGFLEGLFGRINSKRLMVLYGYLLWLLYSKEMTMEAFYGGTAVTVLVILLFVVRPNGKDKITEVKNVPA